MHCISIYKFILGVTTVNMYVGVNQRDELIYRNVTLGCSRNYQKCTQIVNPTHLVDLLHVNKTLYVYYCIYFNLCCNKVTSVNHQGRPFIAYMTCLYVTIVEDRTMAFVI